MRRNHGPQWELLPLHELRIDLRMQLIFECTHRRYVLQGALRQPQPGTLALNGFKLLESIERQEERMNRLIESFE